MTRHGALQILKFGFSGGIATLVHSGIFLVLVSCLVPPVISNAIAFLAAFGVSFIMQARWTFDVQAPTKGHCVRFTVPALVGFLSNSVIVFVTMDVFLWNKYNALAAMIIITIPLTFAINKFWVFSRG